MRLDYATLRRYTETHNLSKREAAACAVRKFDATHLSASEQRAVIDAFLARLHRP